MPDAATWLWVMWSFILLAFVVNLLKDPDWFWSRWLILLLSLLVALFYEALTP